LDGAFAPPRDHVDTVFDPDLLAGYRAAIEDAERACEARAKSLREQTAYPEYDYEAEASVLEQQAAAIRSLEDGR
jgi:hypothetical protein